MNNLTNNFIEYIGVSKKIDTDYISSCERDLEGSYDCNNEIYEILKVYVNTSDIDYEVIDSFRENQICVMCVKLSLTIEYLDNSSQQSLNVVSIDKYFTTYSILPEDFLHGNELVISTYIDNLRVLKINNSQIYYYIHSFITISSF